MANFGNAKFTQMNDFYTTSLPHVVVE